MSDEPTSKPLLTAADIATRTETRIRHPWNPNSEVYLERLAQDAGLQRVALTLARVPPGKESFAYHSHERDEEFLFILSGRGRAEIDGKLYEVGPGDFMGFTAPGVAHHLINPYEEDLVYLMGGERSNLDIGHFPKLGRHIIFGPSGINGADDASSPRKWWRRPADGWKKYQTLPWRPGMVKRFLFLMRASMWCYAASG